MAASRGNRVFRVTRTVFLVFVVGAFFVVLPGVARAQQLQQAPKNPAFLKHVEQVKQRTLRTSTASGHPVGHVPSPIDLSHAKNLPDASTDTVAATAYPATYDLRDTHRVTSVKDQGNCGSCWAFATMASIESKLKGAAGTGTSTNYSEQDLNANHGFDIAECDGGNELMSMAYLARWSGPINESGVPYPYTAENPAAVQSPNAPVRKHVQDVDLIRDRSSFTNNNRIKMAVTKNGALYVSCLWDDSFYQATNHAYWYKSGGSPVGHAVAIIGWDDNYSRTKFKAQGGTRPAGNGAFLVKNSWGTSWGAGGYFWMSYYDRSLETGASFRGVQATSNYHRKYEYDTYGWVTSVGAYPTASTTFWGANIFTANADAPNIKAVSFYTASPNTVVTIYVRKNVTAGNPDSGTLVGTPLTKTIPTMGYHTVVFSTPRAVTAGKRFSVQVRFNTPGYDYPLPVEYAEPGWSSAATAAAGQSFFSEDGTTWNDLTADFDPTANVCIKAFGNGS